MVVKVTCLIFLLMVLTTALMLIGFELGKDSVHRKIDKAMCKCYDKVTKEKHSIEFLYGVEYADDIVIKVLHDWYKEDEFDEKNA